MPMEKNFSDYTNSREFGDGPSLNVGKNKMKVYDKQIPIEESKKMIENKGTIVETPEHDENDYDRTRRFAAEKLDEDLQRAKEIFGVFQTKRKELDEKKDNSPILLIRKGSYVYESPLKKGGKTRYQGRLDQDILVTMDKDNIKKLNLLYSFDSNNNQKFGGSYHINGNFDGHFVLEKSIQNRGKIDHFGRSWAIDLNHIKDTEHLKALLK